MVVGLIGCGRWGANILRDLRRLECDVVVVARSDESTGRARDGGAAAVVHAIDELETDAVVIATPTTTHASVVEQALSLGPPVFVEKPLSNSAEDAARIAALGAGRLFVMDKWRYHPAVRALAEIAASGRLGLVRGVRTRRVDWGKRHDDVDCSWVLAPHDLAIALEVLGALPRPVAASAYRSAGRVVALHGLLDLNGVWHALEVSERAPAGERRVELHCEDGVAVLGGGWDEHVTLHRAGTVGERMEERVEATGELPLLAELRAFVEHVRGGPAPRSSAAEGLAAVEAIAELRRLAGVA